MSPTRSTLAALAAFALAATLGGCASAVPLTAASDANNPDCASVIVRLPDLVGDQQKRETNAQSTAAWGTPESVILTCGVKVPAASTLPCFDKQGIFWLRDDTNDTYWTFRTFGRDPAIELAVDRDIASGPGVVIDDLTSAVAYLPTDGRECTDLEDTVTGGDVPPLPDATETPAPTPTTTP